jgi:hypothetical protein
MDVLCQILKLKGFLWHVMQVIWSLYAGTYIIIENGARRAWEITEYFNQTRCMKGLPLITHPL